jgi:hypothetical protein
MQCVWENSGVLVINIYSLLWYKYLLLTKAIGQSLQVLLNLMQINTITTDGPIHVERKFHFTPHLRTFMNTAAIATVVLRCKSGTDSTISLCMTSLINPRKKKSIGVKSEFYWSQLIGHSPPIHQPGHRSTSAVRTIAPKWAGDPSHWKIGLSTSVTICRNTKFSSTCSWTAIMMVLSWKKQCPRIQSDMKSDQTLTLGLSQICFIRACGFSLSQKPAIMMLYNTVCVWKVTLLEKTWLNNSCIHAVPTFCGTVETHV